MINVLIADDHAVVRSGLRQFFAITADFGRIGEAPNGATVLQMLDAEPWDVVLLDIGLPDINGIHVLKRIRSLKPDLPVLIFSMLPEEEHALNCLEAGASGYLPKDSLPERILEAIRAVSRGERYVTPQMVERLIRGNASHGLRAPHEALSARELEVMHLLSQGLALTAIGMTLSLSPKTITTYRARILEKLNLHSNAELARYVVEHRLGDKAVR